MQHTMTNEERLDHIEQKLDTLNDKVIRLSIWETIGKMSIGGIIAAATVEIIHYLGVLHP